MVTALLVLAALANREGDGERAARLLGTIEAIKDRYHARPPVGMARRLAAIQGPDPDLDAPANRAAFEAGRAMTLEEAVGLGLAER